MMAHFSDKIRSVLSHWNDGQRAVAAFAGTVLLASLAVTGSLAVVRQLGALQESELKAYDRFIRLRPDEGPDRRLLVVAITEEDIQQRREYPIFDGTLAELLQKIEAYQPRAIGLDVLRDVPQGTGREALIEFLVGQDNLIAACKLSSADEPGNPAAPGVPEERIGFADLPLDEDVTIRRSILVSTPQPSKFPIPTPHLCNYPDPENQIPSLAFNLALLYLEGEGIALEPAGEGELKLGRARIGRLDRNAGGYRNLDASDYQILLNYRSAKNAARQVTLTQVLKGQVTPSWIRDRIVLVGYTAQSANDDFSTPFSAGLQDGRKMPGVILHAQSVSQLLSAALDGRPLIWYWPLWKELLWMGVWSIVGGILAWSIRRPWLFCLASGLAIAVLVGICYACFLWLAGWIPLVPAALSAIVTAGLVISIDRFNKSSYGQTFYQGVRKILRIEIDETQKERELAELVDSDFFQRLEEKRSQLEPSPEEAEPGTAEDTPPTSQGEEDYFQQLQQKGRKLRNLDGEPDGSEE